MFSDEVGVYEYPSGVSHMTPPEVAENRLVLELTFLKEALGV